MTADDPYTPVIPAFDPEAARARRTAQNRVTVMIVALAAASVAFRLLTHVGLRHSALVFIGLPTLMAVVVARSEKPAVATEAVMRVITLALLLSSIVFAEAMVCIAFAAPIFYLMGYLVTKAVQGIRGIGRHRGGMTMLMLILLPTGLEGVAPALAWNRDERVTRTRIVRATPAQVRATLAARPGFDAPLPPFLRIGFPVPVATRGSGLAVGDERAIVFEHAHGGHRERGTLAFRIARSDSMSVRFEPIHDDSYITHWLAWESSEVRWRAVSPTETRVEWTLRYRRRLDPAWYFAPLERYGVGVAAGYLIDALAVPSTTTATMPMADSPLAEHHHGP